MTEVEIPNVGKVKIDRTIDCKGMVCPRPQLEVKKAIQSMKSGEVAEVLITNPPSVRSVTEIIKKMKCELLANVKEGNVFKLYFKKL